MAIQEREDSAEFSAYEARGVVECVDVGVHPQALESGWWVVVGEAGGRILAWRFAEVEARDQHTVRPASTWIGPARTEWTSSLSAKQYVEGVEHIRQLIGAGQLEQCNLTRILKAPLLDGRSGAVDARALYQQIRVHHPSPHAGFIQVAETAGAEPIWLVSASPELFLRREEERIASRPIKGTAQSGAKFLEKDDLESKFIAGRVASQFSNICAPGRVGISDPQIEEHPGLIHLVREVRGDLRPGVSWAEIFGALFPPASVGGFPQNMAKRVVSRLEMSERGPYCGIFGWVDGDAQRAELAVTIRSFWWRNGILNFGTGAGITSGSNPALEWRETELKAERLLNIASERVT